MIVLLSPAKTLDFDAHKLEKHSIPRLLEDSGKLIKTLKKKSAADIQELMGVSEKISTLNVERYKSYQTPFTLENAKQAILAFKGDVYLGLEAEAFNGHELNFAQKHLRILSGLYGVLRPLDLMQPYRLEMGTSLKTGRRKNLYAFWDKKVTELINQDLSESKSKVVLNLASKEYFQVIKPDLLDAEVLNIHFKENRNGKYKVISFNAKKARGRMAHLLVKERITKPALLKTLVVNDYVYNEKLSEGNDWVFTID